MSREFGKDCLRSGCIAFALPGEVYCVVHRRIPGLDRGQVPPSLGLQPVTGRIERDADGLPVRFYPETRRRP